MVEMIVKCTLRCKVYLFIYGIILVLRISVPFIVNRIGTLRCKLATFVLSTAMQLHKEVKIADPSIFQVPSAV